MPEQRGFPVSKTDELKGRFLRQDATVAVIGLGYVGLPLVREFGSAGFKIIGVDVDRAKVEHLNRGESYIRHIESRVVQSLIDEKRFHATLDFGEIAEADAIVVCVPTPLTKHQTSVDQGLRECFQGVGLETQSAGQATDAARAVTGPVERRLIIFSRSEFH